MGAARAKLVGQKFGRLTVVERDGVDAHKHMIWRCRCECGGQTFVATDGLRRGYTRTCGCSKRLRYASTALSAATGALPKVSP
jgi:hypothetical protein